MCTGILDAPTISLDENLRMRMNEVLGPSLRGVLKS